MFEKMLADRLQRINKFPYEDIHLIDKYPITVSQKVLKELIETACQSQNMGNIELARYKINEINKEWLNKYFLQVAFKCVDFSDEWEYRRLVELVVLVIPELKQKVLDIGEKSDNEDIREAVEDYKGTNERMHKLFLEYIERMEESRIK